MAGVARVAINAPRATYLCMELLLFQSAAPRRKAETGLRDHGWLLHPDNGKSSRRFHRNGSTSQYSTYFTVKLGRIMGSSAENHATGGPFLSDNPTARAALQAVRSGGRGRACRAPRWSRRASGPGVPP